ncbi:Electrogenic sodium bicarbonate cotransporter 1 [Bagarius yarrelli]|uniref:Electrogenic sodium bicarbonate cotransporter 1 n=1 Tax=Bagarius yarrelli TaxID=175774 RepID=A0A556U839_BAGYA|nr:Electrogenic sodium bicarbonate cotransporter 1 [Bagarius yarrelli]
MAGLSSNMLQVNQPRSYGSMLSLEEKCEQSFFLFYYYRMEDEAVLDRGASFLKHVCDEEEVEGHHTIYIGVHVPKSYRRRRRHRRRTSHKERKEKVTEQTEETGSSILKPTVLCVLTISCDYFPKEEIYKSLGQKTLDKIMDKNIPFITRTLGHYKEI